MVNLESVNPTLSLSAPAAFSFDVPVELSCKEVSEDESIILSVIVKPILYDGLNEYFSSINSCASTLTKKPLRYIIPSDIFAIEPIPQGAFSVVSTWNSLSFDTSEYVPPEST